MADLRTPTSLHSTSSWMISTYLIVQKSEVVLVPMHP
jgi:hypothetical protein